MKSWIFNKPESYMFSFFPLKSGLMQASGSALLKLIQNDEMNLFDLLVRESVQNSLDAELSKDEPVWVEYLFHKCKAEEIAEMFPEIGGSLQQRFEGESRMLEIRDTGTTGLTGDIGGLSRRPGQNLIKLVFEISKSHETYEGAETGGSWGLGKTVYYRMGAGLVIYYSRVLLEDGLHQERFVACIVENEELQARMIPEVETGIAWWGGNNVMGEDGRQWPSATTDSGLIRAALERLDVRPFIGKETGTAVIIPFLGSDLLPKGVPEGHDEDDTLNGQTDTACFDRWYGGEDGYVENALYKWYAVRLNNWNNPHGAPLLASVNGREVGKNMPRFYWIIQSLYNMAVNTGLDNRELDSIREEDLLIEGVSIRQTFTGETIAGWIAAVRLLPIELGMAPPDNERSPFVRLFNEDRSEPYIPIVGYLRKPGMIVSWNDDPWVNGIKVDPEGRIIIALFVPNSSKSFQSDVVQRIDRNKEIKSLEQYLRLVEKADHSQWRDRERTGLKVVEKIRKGCLKLINNKFVDIENERVPEVDLGLARFLADAFLPQGFGRDARDTFTPSPPHNPGPDSKKGKATLVVEKTRFERDVIVVDWILHWGKEGKISQKLVVSVATEGHEITTEQWQEDGMPGSFPFEVVSARVSRISTNRRGRNPDIDLTVDGVNEKVSNELMSLERRSTTVIFTSLLDDGMEGMILKGELRITRHLDVNDLCAQIGLVDVMEMEGKEL